MLIPICLVFLGVFIVDFIITRMAIRRQDRMINDLKTINSAYTSAETLHEFFESYNVHIKDHEALKRMVEKIQYLIDEEIEDGYTLEVLRYLVNFANNNCEEL